MTEHYNLPVCSPVTGTIFFCLSVYLGKCDWQRILLGNPGEITQRKKLMGLSALPLFRKIWKVIWLP